MLKTAAAEAAASRGDRASSAPRIDDGGVIEDGRCMREEIAALLRERHDQQRMRDEQRAAEDAERRDHTRSLVRVMQLETRDQCKLREHTERIARELAIARAQEETRQLEDWYQAEKKRFAAIPDKQQRHALVQAAKQKKDAAMRLVNERVQALGQEEDREGQLGSVRPRSSTKRTKPASSEVYRRVMDQIRDLRKTRSTMVDPYAANLAMAKLWKRIDDQERCVENYQKACKCMTAQQRSNVPPHLLEDTLETERRRRREALKFLFLRALNQNERKHTAELMSQYLALSLQGERLETVAYLERLLRNQAYIEDPTLASMEAVTISVLSTGSLGPLTDLRFQLLQELLAASPSDPYLIESVANIHVRRVEYDKSKASTDSFVRLPIVKQMAHYRTLAQFTPGELKSS